MVLKKRTNVVRIMVRILRQKKVCQYGTPIINKYEANKHLASFCYSQQCCSISIIDEVARTYISETERHTVKVG